MRTGHPLMLCAALFVLVGAVACNGIDPEPTPADTPSQSDSAAPESTQTAGQQAATPTVECEVGMRLAAGQSCSHEGGGSFFRLEIRDDHYACVGGICGGESLNINNLSVVRNGDEWRIASLP